MEFCWKKSKARWRYRRRALMFPDLCGSLRQATQVRRHEVSMMVVMTVMAATLHLIHTVS
jgi:hypothetical protein